MSYELIARIEGFLKMTNEKKKLYQYIIIKIILHLCIFYGDNHRIS